ncbi:MAG: isoprenyl transferase [Schleiferiaceae bacterium]|jgi:undecaprenyl diphosphate synthase|nr:isoprenyl transferase [Schleiferiaceae bacterium]
MASHQLDLNNIPQHIAIIMDGNGRWAKKQGFGTRVKGHENGVAALRALTTTAAELGVGYLTVYAFSTENWNRPKFEVNALMRLLVNTLKNEVDTLMKNNIRLNAIGNIDSLPSDVASKLKTVMDKTAVNSHMTLTLALSYGSRDEMKQAVQKIALEVKDGLISADDINEELISKNLFTSDMPDPDLLIRTSGEQRISNYLLWQIAYAELFFTETLWPDFAKEDLYQAISSYQNRERRYGKTSEQIKEA